MSESTTDSRQLSISLEERRRVESQTGPTLDSAPLRRGRPAVRVIMQDSVSAYTKIPFQLH
jgi:hypothetical protein